MTNLKSTSSHWLSAGGLALGVVLLLAVNILSNATLGGMRLDLTENKLYTLSPGTRSILSNLEEPVTLRLFLSQRLATRLPAVSSYAIRVRELLLEYERLARGQLRLRIIDPEPFSEEEDRALGYGLQGIPLGGDEENFYFGLVGTGPTDEQVVIPFFSPDREEFLEYDITKLIDQVARPQRPVVGLLSSLPIDGMAVPGGLQGGFSRPWVVVEQMRQLFEVRVLATDVKTIPEDVDVLMLVHPRDWDEATLYAIDQFVLAGGHALVFVDPHAEAGQPAMGGMPAGQASELDRLLEAWGIALTPSQVIGDLQLAERVRFNRQPRAVAVEYPVWMTLTDDQMNADDIVTANLGSITLATPGRLTKQEQGSTEVLHLFETTTNAMQIDASRLTFLGDPQELLREFRPAGEPYLLAARVTGPVSSAFPEGAPQTQSESEGPADEEEEQPAAKNEEDASKPHLSASKDDINVIVVADTDLLQDRFWVRVQDLLGTQIAIPSAANGTFVINALDNLTGSNELISVRNRGHFSRPFARVQMLRQEAELQYRAKEQELLSRLAETEQKLGQLESGKQEDSALVVSAEQQREIERFRQERVRIRKELRDVRHALRKNIQGLEAWMKFVNVALIPLIVAVGGVIVGLHRIRRRKGISVSPARG